MCFTIGSLQKYINFISASINFHNETKAVDYSKVKLLQIFTQKKKKTLHIMKIKMNSEEHKLSKGFY